MSPAPKVPWQAKFIALVFIWGSSFLLMKVGLESFSALQIAALRLLTGAVTILLLLWMRGGSLPRERWVWGHLVVTGLLLGTLPFVLFALSETRVSSALAGIGNAATPIATVLATMAFLPGARATKPKVVAVIIGFIGVVTIMQPWASARPDLVGFGMALAGGVSYGIGWTYNRRFLARADLGGLSQPAATLLMATVLMVPVIVVWAALQRLDPQVENAARSLGASQATILGRVVLPQVMPGLLSGGIIVFALAASAFATPAIIGGRRLKVASTLAYDEFLNTLNWPMGAAVAVLLLVALVLIIVVSNRLIERRYQAVFE